MKDRVEAVFRRSPLQIAVLLVVMGIALCLADRYGRKRRLAESATIADLFWTGVGQALAIIPGFSRSGTTMTAGLMLGLEREAAARLSFLLGWPATLRSRASIRRQGRDPEPGLSRGDACGHGWPAGRPRDCCWCQVIRGFNREKLLAALAAVRA